MNRITVGVDGSKNAHAALEWAVAEATLREADLQIVNSWQLPAVSVGMAFGEYFEACQARSRALVAEASGWARERLHTTVSEVSEQGSPVELLAREAQNSTMVVVGSRGHGGFVGLILGSVSSQLAHHAACPVVVVPEQSPSPSQD